MKIEASHYDTVEWNPEPIAPGTFINDPQIERNCSTERKDRNFKRLGVIFISNSGKPTEKILGLITAWDIGKIIIL